MTAERRKVLLTFLTAACVIGAGGLIYVGYALFRDRTAIFAIFSIYTLLITGVVLFFGVRLIDFHRPEK